MTTSKKHLEIALGGNMHTSSLTTLAIEEIMTDFAKQYHKEQLILSGVSKSFYCLDAGIKGSEHLCKKQCDSCNRFQQ